MNPRKGLSDGPKGPVWCFIDSGCNRHIVKRPEYFIKKHKITDPALCMHMNYNGNFVLDTVGSASSVEVR
jgi:hypothetical protein